ncbi:MAG: hypothetical protein M3065_01580, partial [Actinomycetota bacterium]|nr:hypothetical protein [Actinomycetota bacterium]
MTTDPTGGTSAWKPVRGRPRLGAMSCPGSHLCVAINGSDQILTSRDPAGPSARWKVVRLPGHPKLSLVSCPDQHFCVILDTSNRVAIARNPTGNSRSWKIT